MGFPEEDVIKALKATGNNQRAAVCFNLTHSPAIIILPCLTPDDCTRHVNSLASLILFLKNSLIIQEQNTKKNHKRVVVLYVIKNHVNLHKL